MMSSTRRKFLMSSGALAAPTIAGLAGLGARTAEAAPAAVPPGNPHDHDLTTANVLDFDASGSAYTTTGSISQGTTQLKVKDVGDFATGQGIYIAGAGPSKGPLVTSVADVDAGDNVLVVKDAASTSVTGAGVQHDDTDAIRRAFASLGRPAGGRLGFPEGIYRISSTLDFDLGYPKAPAAFYQSTPIQWFELQMIGRISPVPGIGAAMDIHAGIFPIINFKIDGGGRWGDYGLKIRELLDAQVEVFAKSYAGTALYVTGSIPDTQVGVSSLHKLYATNCGRALLLEGMYGLGLIGEVWDLASVHGSIIRNAADVSIGHWENYAPGSQDISLDFQNCGAVHLGRIALGDSATVLMRVKDCLGFNIDMFYGLGNAFGRNTTLVIEDSIVTLSNAFVQHAGETAIYVKGSTVAINNYTAGDNRYHLQLGASEKSTEVRADIRAVFGDAFKSASWGSVDGSREEDIVIDKELTGGYLQLSGNTRNTNTSGQSGQYAVHCHSPNFEIFTNGFRQEHSNVSGGIGHPDPKKVVVSGGRIDDGVVSAS